MKYLLAAYCLGPARSSTYKRVLKVGLELAARGHEVLCHCAGGSSLDDDLTREAARTMRLLEDPPGKERYTERRLLQILDETRPDVVVLGETPFRGILVTWTLAAIQRGIPVACLDVLHDAGFVDWVTKRHTPLLDRVVLTGPKACFAAQPPAVVEQVPPFTLPERDQAREFVARRGLDPDNFAVVWATEASTSAFGASLARRLAGETDFLVLTDDAEPREDVLYGVLELARLAILAPGPGRMHEVLSLGTPVITLDDEVPEDLAEIAWAPANPNEADGPTVEAARRLLGLGPEAFREYLHTTRDGIQRAADCLEAMPPTPRQDATLESERLGFTRQRIQQALQRLHPDDRPAPASVRVGVTQFDQEEAWTVAVHHEKGFTRLAGRTFPDETTLEEYLATLASPPLLADRDARLVLTLPAQETLPFQARSRNGAAAAPSLPDPLVKVLPEGAVQRLEALGCNLDLLCDLQEGHRRQWDLEDQSRSRSATDTDLAVTKRGIDALNSRRHDLIAAFDAPLRERSRPDGRLWSETPGELCDRLLILDLKWQATVQKQHDATLPDELRRLCLQKVEELGQWRAHLFACLEALARDLQEGTAQLPPRSELKLYNHKLLNPVTRKEQDAPPLHRRAQRRPGVRHVVGLGFTLHGASVAYVGADGTTRASVLDRWTGQKHTLMLARAEMDDILYGPDVAMKRLIQLSYGRIPPYRAFEESFQEWFAWLTRGLDVQPSDIDLVVTSPSHMATNAYRLGPQLGRWFPRAQTILDLEHYPIHEAQAFWQSGLDEAAVLTLDNCGEDLARLAGRKCAGGITVMNRRGEVRRVVEFLFPDSSSGLLYSHFTGHCGFKEGEEGKTMGLAPYGNDELYRRLAPRLQLRPDGSFDFMSPEELEHALSTYVPERPDGKALLTKRHENVAYAGQALLERIVTNAFEAAVRLTGLKTLVYAGGVGLNSCANELARRAAGVERFYVAPNASDAGQALGCALYGAYEVGGWEPRAQEIPEYLGPTYTEAEIEEAARSTRYHLCRPSEPEKTLARLIANGRIGSRFAGGAEYGPRALGNRSMLADPRPPGMRDFLNDQVKFRETFRPYAPSVLAEHVDEWFDMGGDPHSPYMLRVVPVWPERIDQVPAITHVDGTARVQTVSREANPRYYALIQAFHELTGVPMVLNTSFNLAGKPIVETPRHAVECYEATRLDALLLGDWLLTKEPL